MYEKLLRALKGTGIPFAEVAWDQRPARDYGVIAIDGAGDSLGADMEIVCQAIEGSIDLYTYGNDRTHVATIQGVLNGMDGCAWYLNSIQYEQENRIIHWEWIFQLETM